MTEKLTVGMYRQLESKLDSIEERSKTLEQENNDLKQKMKEAQDKGSVLSNHVMSNKSHSSQPVSSRPGSEEQKCLNWFGAYHVKDLLNKNTESLQYRSVPRDVKNMVMNLKKEFQNARIIAQLFCGDPLDRIGNTEDQDKFSNCKSILDTYYAKEVLIPRLKAFGTGVVGGGAEWIPTAIASTYIPEVELDRQVVGALRQIDMPTSPYELPTAGGFTKARRIAENTSMTDTSFVSSKVTFTAAKYGEYFVLPEELNEDSIVGMLDLARQELTNAHLRAYEACVINGVKIGTAHIDADTQAGSANLAEKQFHGLRYLGIGNTANGGTYDYLNGAITDAKLRAHRKNMGKFGVNPDNLIWIVGPSAYYQMLGTENVVTVDKLGPNATVLKGTLGVYQGIQIMQSGYMRQDLNATGIYDGVTADRTGLLLVHKQRWYWATRRPIRMALRECLSKDDRYEIASYSRVDFQGHPQSASEVDVVYGLNVPS